MTDDRQKYLDLLNPPKPEGEKIPLGIDKDLLKKLDDSKIRIALKKDYAKQCIDEWIKDANDRR